MFQLLIVFVLYIGLGIVITWLLYRLACMLDDVRYLAEVAAAQGRPVERKESPLKYFVIVAGAIAVPLLFCLSLRINPLGWLF